MKIIICTPTLTSTTHIDFNRSMDEALAVSNQRGWQLAHAIGAGSSVLPRVRNFLVAQALAAEADQVLFVDSDMGFSGASFERIISRPEDVVGAAYQKRPKRWNDPPQLTWQPLPDTIGNPFITEEGLVLVAGLGTGFLKVRTDVFRSLRQRGLARPYILDESDPVLWPHTSEFFSYELVPITDSQLLARLDEHNVPREWRYHDPAEDFYFCALARRGGYKVWLDSTLGVNHWEGGCLCDFSLASVQGALAQQQAT